jgi:hypothetical protein
MIDYPLLSDRHPCSRGNDGGKSSSVFLVVFDFGEFGIDDIFVSRSFFRSGVSRSTRSLFFLVDRFAELHRDLGQGGCLFLHRFGLAAFDSHFGFGHRSLDFAFQSIVDLVAMFLQLLLSGVDKAFGIVLGFRRLTTLLVFLGKGFGVADHLIDIGIGQAA